MAKPLATIHAYEHLSQNRTNTGGRQANHWLPLSKVPDRQRLTVYPIDFIGRRLRRNWGKLIVENSNEISRQILIMGYWRDLYEEASLDKKVPL